MGLEQIAEPETLRLRSATVFTLEILVAVMDESILDNLIGLSLVSISIWGGDLSCYFRQKFINMI